MQPLPTGVVSKVPTPSDETRTRGPVGYRSAQVRDTRAVGKTLAGGMPERPDRCHVTVLISQCGGFVF